MLFYSDTSVESHQRINAQFGRSLESIMLRCIAYWFHMSSRQPSQQGCPFFVSDGSMLLLPFRTALVDSACERGPVPKVGIVEERDSD